MNLYPLPSLILLSDYGGDWERYKCAIYQIFMETIVAKLDFLGLSVSCKYFQPIGGMHRSFWHLITESPEKLINDEDRIPDMRRCERIRWISHFIVNYQNSNIACWENKRGSNINTVLWFQPENYMIILSKRKNYYLLTTAYCHRESKSKKNLKEMQINPDPRKD
jgi:hypothetical protein